jgi:hypothetical protein
MRWAADENVGILLNLRSGKDSTKTLGLDRQDCFCHPFKLGEPIVRFTNQYWNEL